MSDIATNNPIKPNKSEQWVNHIKCWEESNLSQPDYCKQAGIGYSTFVYWRGKLSKNNNVQKIKFAPVTVDTKKSALTETPKSIQIKLVTGHIVYIPVTLPIHDIAALINALGNINA